MMGKSWISKSVESRMKNLCYFFILLTIATRETEGGIVANFTIMFEYVSTDEIVVLQNAIEDDGYIDDLQVKPIEFKSADVPSKPVNITTRAVSSTSIEIDWNEVKYSTGGFSVVGYAIYFKRYQPNQETPWYKVTVPLQPTVYNISYLKPFTLYTFRVLAFHNGGNGISSEFIDEKTAEGVPAEAPRNFMCTTISPTEISMIWDYLDSSLWNGYEKEYIVEYKLYATNNFPSNKSYSSTVRETMLTGLTPNTRYEIYLRAATSVGVGKRAWCEVKTDEGVPSVGPHVTAQLDPDRPTEAIVEWGTIPSDKINGNLQGYTLSYGESRSGKESIEYPEMTHVELDKFTFRYVLKGLPVYSQMKIVVKGRTGVGEGEPSEAAYIDTCTCPTSVYATWFENKPYITDQENGQGQVSGIFPDYIGNMLNQLCGICPAGKTEIFWDRTQNGRSPVRKSQKDLKEQVDNNAHFHVAMFGRSEIETFQSDYKYVNIIGSPGIAFIVRDPLAELDKTAAIMTSLASCWPAIIIIFLFSMVSGIFIWVADCNVNAEEFPGESFIKGIYHGAYWAFVSMTTVGYGDKTPKSFLAQVIAIAWMLMGPIINGIVVGAITTSLTTVNLESDPKIYGTVVGAIQESFEFNLGVRRNAKMDHGFNYTDSDKMKMINDLADSKIDGVLMDSLVAADMYDVIGKKKLKISKLIPEKSGWGVILSSDILRLENEIRSYVAEMEEKMKEIVNNATDGKLTIGSKPPSSLDTGIVDPDSQAFKDFVKFGLIAYVIMCIAGFTFEKVLKRIRSRKVKPYSQEHRELLEDDLATVVTDFCEELLEMIQAKSNKHESELKRLFWKKGYSFGVDGWFREKTNDEAMLKNKIRYHEIMSKDLGLKTKKTHSINNSMVWLSGKSKNSNVVHVSPIQEESSA